MGHRDSRSLNQNSRSDRRQVHQASAPSSQKLREAAVSPSALIEAVDMLDEPTSVVEALVSTGFSGDATVCGDLALTQTEWVTDVTPLEFSVADDEPARDVRQR